MEEVLPPGNVAAQGGGARAPTGFTSPLLPFGSRVFLSIGRKETQKIIVTNLKPDITIWDKENNKFHIFELTVPLDVNISQRNIDKSNKYAHFATDIKHINTTVTAFEISSTGNVSSDNKKSLTSLHKFCKPGIKLSTFIKNISSLSIYSSYHIWLCRNDPVFVTPSYLPAPFQPNP